MNDPIRYWVCVWDNHTPTLHADKESVLDRIFASGVRVDEVDDSGDMLYVDDWVVAYLTPLTS
jgi:hypothetical protein